MNELCSIDSPSLTEELQEIDLLFGQAFGKTKEEQTFLSQVMQGARNGHLCVHKKASFPFPFIREVDETVKQFDSLIGKWGNWYYLQRNWVIESKVADMLYRLMNRMLSPIEMEGSQELTSEQREATEKVSRQSIVAITGGPGTGKTHLIRHLASQFLEKSEGKLLLAAPTGKASSQLKERLDALTRSYADRIDIGTIHALLQIHPSEDLLFHESQLEGDLLIVDECSMIDAATWAALLRAIQTNTRVVLLGDQEQLPPIEAGTLFGEICRYFSDFHPTFFVCLKKSMRTSNSQLLQWAEQIRSGKLPSSLSYTNKCDWDHWANYFPSPQMTFPNIPELFAKMQSFRILSCLHNGPLGVVAVNEQISKRLRSSFRGGGYWPVPLLIRRTSKELGIANGDVGILMKRSGFPYPEKGETVFFLTPQGIKKIDPFLLPSFDYGYCLSVHKSQGSEYDQIAFLIPPGSERFGREILYTGITRARSSCQVISSLPTLEKCLSFSSRKTSQLRLHLLKRFSK